jgi:rubrerythrin
MNPGSFFLLLAVLLFVIFFVTRPFLRRERMKRVDDQELSGLLAERDRILGAIQELDFDHSLGKIPEDEFPARREALVRCGAEILKQLDEHAGQKKSQVKEAPAQIRSDDDIEDLIASRRSKRKEKTGGFCPECGKTIHIADHFCPKCGQPLKEQKSHS